ncbi:sugar ABC transporter ATP-binding protein [Streptomyces sp. NBC_00322]|uniref:sugar ABC transporter ATP-binding protein n=1 Tax=Streptomyces sp. NBC_00322 TaxID=2975712 RepID=UPI002E2B8CFA|nr:sugar ABC transporter ATP-binding protein [Streptomyces sp. NBC_00322]
MGALNPTTAGEPPLVLSLEAVGKRFGSVQALSDISLNVYAGEVLALMGENGAGKSTLLRTLSGDHQPDTGRLLAHGLPVFAQDAPGDMRVVFRPGSERLEYHGGLRGFASPRDAQRAGIRVICQEPEIIPHVSVAENVYVGVLPSRGRFVNRRVLFARMRADLEKYGFADVISPEALGTQLSPAQRQLVEILRALVGRVKLIAFDEPTSSLSQNEATTLFRLIQQLRNSGVAVIYVSHRMHEIFELADRVAVLRDGRLVGTRRIGGTTEQELVRMMVGRDLSAMFHRRRCEPGPLVLQVDGIGNDDVHDVSLQVRAGEVVGLAGLIGAGRSELARAIAGDTRIHTGWIRLEGKRLKLRTPRDAIEAGIGLAPEERKADALLLGRSVRENTSLAVLGRLSRLRMVDTRSERALVEAHVKQLRIRAVSIEQEVRRLSGGNQQKVVLARWLARKPKVLILDEPTRGVDVGAKAEIYRIIDELANSGVALIVISSELPELLGIADRIVVLQGGRVTGELDHTQATEERILSLAMTDRPTG